MTDLERVRDDLRRLAGSDYVEQVVRHDLAQRSLGILAAHLKEDEDARARSADREVRAQKAEAELARLRAENYGLSTAIDAYKDDLANSTPNGELARLKEKHEVLREKYVLVHAERDRLLAALKEISGQILIGDARDIADAVLIEENDRD